MSSTVFVPGPRHPSAAPGRLQPAFRAWADALMLRYSESKTEPRKDAQPAFRQTAQIGRLRPTGHYVLPVTVDLAACRLATSSDSLNIYFPPSWTDGLLEYLVDWGFAVDLVQEMILPCAAPMVRVGINGIMSVIESTPADLIGAVEHYFANDLRKYVDSIRAIGTEASDDFEVVIPDGGVTAST